MTCLFVQAVCGGRSSRWPSTSPMMRRHHCFIVAAAATAVPIRVVTASSVYLPEQAKAARRTPDRSDGPQDQSFLRERPPKNNRNKNRDITNVQRRQTRRSGREK